MKDLEIVVRRVKNGYIAHEIPHYNLMHVEKYIAKDLQDVMDALETIIIHHDNQEEQNA